MLHIWNIYQHVPSESPKCIQMYRTVYIPYIEHMAYRYDKHMVSLIHLSMYPNVCIQIYPMYRYHKYGYPLVICYIAIETMAIEIS